MSKTYYSCCDINIVNNLIQYCDTSTPLTKKISNNPIFILGSFNYYCNLFTNVSTIIRYNPPLIPLTSQTPIISRLETTQSSDLVYTKYILKKCTMPNTAFVTEGSAMKERVHIKRISCLIENPFSTSLFCFLLLFFKDCSISVLPSYNSLRESKADGLNSVNNLSTCAADRTNPTACCSEDRF